MSTQYFKTKNIKAKIDMIGTKGEKISPSVKTTSVYDWWYPKSKAKSSIKGFFTSLFFYFYLWIHYFNVFTIKWGMSRSWTPFEMNVSYIIYLKKKKYVFIKFLENAVGI